MCSCDLVNPDVFRSTIRKARKQHKCCECGATIQPSSKYVDIFGVWDGEPGSYKQCLECSEIGDRLTKENDCGYAIGGLFQELIDSDFIDRNQETEEWESTVDWIKVTGQEPLQVAVSGGVCG